MLILTRKIGERIIVGDDVLITIVDIKGKQVKVGIDAPPILGVHREEVYRKILEENKVAATTAFEDVAKFTLFLQPEGRDNVGDGDKYHKIRHNTNR